MVDLTGALKDYVKELGADLVGVASAEALNQKAPPHHRPQDLLPGARAVVSFGLKMLRSIFATPNIRVPRINYVHLHRRLNEIAWEIAGFLESRGHYAIPISSDVPIDMIAERGLWGDLSHRHVAVAAGLGEIGRSSLLLTPEYGARIRVSSVITTAPLIPDEELAQGLCPPQCRLCLEGCPAQAISEAGVDKKACVRHLHRYNLYGLLRHLGKALDAPGLEERKRLVFDGTIAEVYMSLRSGDPPWCIECVRLCPAGATVE
ncbi:MAG: hypothetical protein ACE5IA_03365 [Dehalococcoidia bacterium]